MFDPPETQLSLLDAHDECAPFTVRYSRRARRLAVRVHLGGRVEVIVPPRTGVRTVQEFLRRHHDWIETRRERARRDCPERGAFPPGELALAAFRESWQLRLVPGAGRTRLVANAAAGVPMAGADAPRVLELRGAPPGPADTRRVLRAWVGARAAAGLAPWLAALGRETGLECRRLSVRRQRTRWGSCSTRGTISLNACLAFQRPEVVRYLLVHELAHTRHMNHSARFWRLVAAHEPGWRALDRELLGGWRRVPDWMMNDVD
ncbi:MAG: M48 family metallopeptidase [Steroidobacteraceae bacterium]